MKQKSHLRVGIFLVFLFLLNACGISCTDGSFESLKGRWRVESIINEQNILLEKLSSLEKGQLTVGDMNYQWKDSRGNITEEGTYVNRQNLQIETQARDSFIFNSTCTFEITITTTKMVMTYIDNQGNTVRINLVKYV